jgi:hypothetical protein
LPGLFVAFMQNAKGTELAILFQAVSVEQFDETRA